MGKLDKLYNTLYENDVLIFDCNLPFSDATVIEMDGQYGLFLDSSQFNTQADETVAVAHESGHIFTGSTHSHNNRISLIDQHENRADKWAIQNLISEDELEKAISNGYKEIWELAELFEVTEDFIKKAVCFYKKGNIAIDMYF